MEIRGMDMEEEAYEVAKRIDVLDVSVGESFVFLVDPPDYLYFTEGTEIWITAASGSLGSRIRLLRHHETDLGLQGTLMRCSALFCAAKWYGNFAFFRHQFCC
jgi:hypothetical protein